MPRPTWRVRPSHRKGSPTCSTRPSRAAWGSSRKRRRGGSAGCCSLWRPVRRRPGRPATPCRQRRVWVASDAYPPPAEPRAPPHTLPFPSHPSCRLHRRDVDAVDARAFVDVGGGLGGGRVSLKAGDACNRGCFALVWNKLWGLWTLCVVEFEKVQSGAIGSVIRRRRISPRRSISSYTAKRKKRARQGKARLRCRRRG